MVYQASHETWICAPISVVNQESDRGKGHGWLRFASHDHDHMIYSLGSSTVSITWITPLPQSMSALTTLALLIFTPSVVSIATD